MSSDSFVEKYGLTTKDQTEFFNRLLSTTQGQKLEITTGKNKGMYTLVFQPAAGALVSLGNGKNPLVYITVRDAKVSITPDPYFLIIHTKNREFSCRAMTPRSRNEFACWIETIANENILIAPATMSDDNPNDDGYRAPFWIPKNEADFCALCPKKFSSFLPSNFMHTCRTCGFILCNSTKCYNEKLKRCTSCLAQTRNHIAHLTPQPPNSPTSSNNNAKMPSTPTNKNSSSKTADAAAATNAAISVTPAINTSTNSTNTNTNVQLSLPSANAKNAQGSAVEVSNLPASAYPDAMPNKEQLGVLQSRENNANFAWAIVMALCAIAWYVAQSHFK